MVAVVKKGNSKPRNKMASSSASAPSKGEQLPSHAKKVKFMYQGGNYSFDLIIGEDTTGGGKAPVSGLCKVGALQTALEGWMSPVQLKYTLFEFTPQYEAGGANTSKIGQHTTSSHPSSLPMKAIKGPPMFTVDLRRHSEHVFTGDWVHERGNTLSKYQCALVFERVPGSYFNLFDKGERVVLTSGSTPYNQGKITRVFYHSIPDYFYEVEREADGSFLEVGEGKLEFPKLQEDAFRGGIR
ncbi:unnamed protein product [Amoebophrya sp. A120]|nr:unnamed protein product [Amoebophrya sp. A120]|eukprot:GSA120T00011427001.1